MHGPDPETGHPIEGFSQVCFIRITVRNPNVIFGDASSREWLRCSGTLRGGTGLLNGSRSIWNGSQCARYDPLRLCAPHGREIVGDGVPLRLVVICVAVQGSEDVAGAGSSALHCHDRHDRHVVEDCRPVAGNNIEVQTSRCIGMASRKQPRLGNSWPSAGSIRHSNPTTSSRSRRAMQVSSTGGRRASRRVDCA